MKSIREYLAALIDSINKQQVTVFVRRAKENEISPLELIEAYIGSPGSDFAQDLAGEVEAIFAGTELSWGGFDSLATYARNIDAYTKYMNTMVDASTQPALLGISGDPSVLELHTDPYLLPMN